MQGPALGERHAGIRIYHNDHHPQETKICHSGPQDCIPKSEEVLLKQVRLRGVQSYLEGGYFTFK